MLRTNTVQHTECVQVNMSLDVYWQHLGSTGLEPGPFVQQYKRRAQHQLQHWVNIAALELFRICIYIYILVVERLKRNTVLVVRVREGLNILKRGSNLVKYVENKEIQTENISVRTMRFWRKDWMQGKTRKIAKTSNTSKEKSKSRYTKTTRAWWGKVLWWKDTLFL